MAGLTRFEPFRGLTRAAPFRNADEFFREFSMMPSLRGMESESLIRIDVSETDKAYLVKADVPGVKKEDIKISIDGNIVSLSATFQENTEEKSGNLMRSERYYGEQYRSFTLPQDVDETKAEARYQDGVLNLNLPKKAGGGSKQITVQ